MIRLTLIAGSTLMALVISSEPPSSWSARAKLPSERAYHVAVTIDGRIYLTAAEESPEMLVYDPAADQWTKLGRGQALRDFPGAAALDGKLYIVGGVGPAPGLKNVADADVYDPVRREWKKLPPLCVTRSRLAAATVGGKLYAIGGFVGQSNDASDTGAVEVYDARTNRWTRKANMPTPRHGLAVTVWKDRIVAVGGFGHGSKTKTDGYGPLGVVEEYDPATDVWTAKPPMPTPRGFLGVGIVKDRMYAIGGHYDLARVECFDLKANKWERLADAPDRWTRFGMAAVGDSIYLMGGELSQRQIARFTP